LSNTALTGRAPVHIPLVLIVIYRRRNRDTYGSLGYTPLSLPSLPCHSHLSRVDRIYQSINQSFIWEHRQQ